MTIFNQSKIEIQQQPGIITSSTFIQFHNLKQNCASILMKKYFDFVEKKAINVFFYIFIQILDLWDIYNKRVLFVMCTVPWPAFFLPHRLQLVGSDQVVVRKHNVDAGCPKSSLIDDQHGPVAVERVVSSQLDELESFQRKQWVDRPNGFGDCNETLDVFLRVWWIGIRRVYTCASSSSAGARNWRKMGLSSNTNSRERRSWGAVRWLNSQCIIFTMLGAHLKKIETICLVTLLNPFNDWQGVDFDRKITFLVQWTFFCHVNIIIFFCYVLFKPRSTIYLEEK